MSDCLKIPSVTLTPAPRAVPTGTLPVGEAVSAPAGAGRVEWLDVLRGMAIFLVVVGHSTLALDSRGLIARCLWSFHLPLFFMISGILHDPARYAGLAAYSRARCRSLLVPYVSFALWACLLLGTLHWWQGGDLGEYWRGAARHVAFGTAVVSPEWFLPCLFVTELCAFLLLRMVNTPAGIIAVACCSAAFGLASSLAGLRCVYWGLSSATVAVLFFAVGYLLRPWVFRVTSRPARPLVRGAQIAVLLLLTVAAASIDPVKNDLMIAQIRPSLFVGGFAGSLACILLAQMVFRNRLLAYLGRNSLAIMYFSVFVPVVCKAAVETAYAQLPAWFLAIHGWGPSRKLLYVLLVVAVIELLNRGMPWSLGKRLPRRIPRHNGSLQTQRHDA